jgi:hypothetical protein
MRGEGSTAAAGRDRVAGVRRVGAVGGARVDPIAVLKMT